MYTMSPAKTLLILLMMFVILLGADKSTAQVAGNVEELELLELVHTPNAGVLKRGQYMVNLQGYGSAGMTAGISIGLFDRFMFGVSYGGDALLGYEDPVWNELPGVLVKYRVIEEDHVFPAITIGFDMQGRGTWFDEQQRYLFKAPGAFAAASRNFTSPFGRFGIHGGVNYNSIEDELDSGLDFFIGADMSLNNQVILLAEYDAALDDNVEDGLFGDGPYGYLNAGVRLVFAQAFVLELNATDLLHSCQYTEGFGREIKIIYIENFSF